jgi:hypothetical protein
MLVLELDDWFWQTVNVESAAANGGFSIGISHGRTANCQ